MKGNRIIVDKKDRSAFLRRLLLLSLLIACYNMVMAQNINVSSSSNQLSPKVLPGNGLNHFDFFYAGEAKSRNMYIVRNGKVHWSYLDSVGRGEISDAVLMKNGDVLFAHQYGVTLISRSKKILWNYNAPEGFETHTAEPFGKNHVVFVQNGNPAKVFVMNMKTNVVEKEFTIPFKSGTHGQVRHARLTARGTLLIAHMDLGKVVEYDTNGKQLSSIDVPGVWSAVELTNGNILVASNNGFVREISPDGKKTVWNCQLSELPGYKITSPQLAVRLDNGNTLVNNWFNQWDSNVDLENQPVQAVEITPKKKVVWELRAWSSPVNLGPSTTIQLLNDKLKARHFGDFK
ncbi:hypothetical protein [Pedobacter sp. UYP30]|uniref:beta-propeller domain-containing protein n=1 Tax=Pedobacter sp. UYP30 TaxID=1756400 RepID=UPI00339A9A72